MTLWTLAACASFDLTLIPVTVDNQDPFGDADAIEFEVEHPDGSVSTLQGGASGTLELSGLPELEGSTIAVRVKSGNDTIAFGRTPELSLSSGGSQTHYVLVSDVDAFAWLETFGKENALGEAVSVGNCRFLPIGGTKATGGGWVGKADTASDDVLVFDVDATGGTVALAVYDALLPEPLVEHTATTLPNGLVLVAGGTSGYNAAGTETDAAYLIDPWGASGPELVDTLTMGRARAGHDAVLNADGRVVVLAGAQRESSGSGTSVSSVTRAEIYDPDSNSFDDLENVDMDGLTIYTEAAGLDEHGALWCGGFDVPGDGAYTTLDQCFLIAPDSSGLTALTDDPLPVGGIHFTLTALGDGRALATGGLDVDNGTQSADAEATKAAWIFDPEKSPGARWIEVGSMIVARQKHAAVALPNGEVLVVGGSEQGTLLPGNDTAGLACAEVFDGESFAVVQACSASDDYNALPGRTQLPSVAYDERYGSLVLGGIDGGSSSEVSSLFVADPDT